MYLANNTQPNIAFAVSLLARFSSSQTRRYWNGVKHIFRYLRGTLDVRLFYSNEFKSEMIGYADADYLSNQHKSRSQRGYLFTYGGTYISWCSMKQTIVTTSSNHVENIAIHEASRECVWLRSITQHIQEMCGFLMKKDNPATATLYEDNSACIAQLKGGYIKRDRTKYISPKFFFTHNLQQNGEINVQ
ncbi:secreted RxLR effector protein 161-like [Nicotiana tabacum]|uniref:Secreted RxLR effector protein 161-like n=1 Tax=Nicotiana tabacum TaxID=4097 RepID=A0AC58U086_TOBAC